MNLSGDAFKAWVCVLCETKLYGQGGAVPPLPRLAFALHINAERLKEHIATLHRHGLLDWDDDTYRVHDWDDWQHPYPSDKPAAVAARVRRHRMKAALSETAGNERNDVTFHRNGVTTLPDVTLDTEASFPGMEGLDPALRDLILQHGPPHPVVSTPLEPPIVPVLPDPLKVEDNHGETVVGEEKEGVQRGKEKPPRGKRIPKDFALTDEMVTYAREAGVSDDMIVRHTAGFKSYYLQATTKNTSLDWVEKWKSNLDYKIQKGDIRANPPSRAQMPEPAHAPAERTQTPSEAGYGQMLDIIQGRRDVGEASAEVNAVAEALGGWETITNDTPSFALYMGTRSRVGGRFPGA